MLNSEKKKLILLEDPLFYCKNKNTYPPFKNGLYLEEFFLEYMKQEGKKYDKNGRLYIPVLWTNFQIEGWFDREKGKMQNVLNKYIEDNSCENGYFTVVQHDDGLKLKLPLDTIVYGACNGNIPLPLIYEDNGNTLLCEPRKNFYEKDILCSFIGTYTHNSRGKMYECLKDKYGFYFHLKMNWTETVAKNDQHIFIQKTIRSRFALAPRGYGRSSFRFFEILQLGTIPIYIWDDIEWLPYKDIVDYSKIAISINIRDIEKLENILLDITEPQYNEMLRNIEKMKPMFELPFMCKYITETF